VIKVAVTMPATIADVGDFLANVRALEAAGAELIGLDGDSPDHWILLGAIAAVTERIRLRTTGSEPSMLRAISRGRTVVGTPSGETWVEALVPPDRDSWRGLMRDLETDGVAGVVVPWDPRLIDLLRNPEPDDRSDLLMSTG
jgi:hypothetical protein